MLTPGQVALARSLDRSNMWDTWKCERPGGREFDGTTGVWTNEPPVTVYDGPGSLSDRSIIGRRVESQGETTVVGTLRLSLPIETSGGVRADDVLTCTESLVDAALVGTAVRVTDVDAQSHASARRFSVEVESWPTTT
jgi:hypothetical protein